MMWSFWGPGSCTAEFGADDFSEKRIAGLNQVIMMITN